MVDGADGMKTGFTKEAGYGLVGSAVQNGLRLIVVVNGVKTAKERADEAKKLLEWGFRNFEQRVLFAEGADDRQAKVYRRRRRPRAAAGARAPVRDHGAEGRRRAADRAHRLSTARCRRRSRRASRIGNAQGLARRQCGAGTCRCKAAEPVEKGNMSQRALRCRVRTGDRAVPRRRAAAMMRA